MKNDSMLASYIYNGKTYNTDDDTGFKDNDSLSIYEVIRVKKGVALFKEDHIDRMINSAKMLNFNMKKSKEEISREIDKLISINNAKNHNIKLVCNDLDKSQNFLSYITSGSYNIEDIPKGGAHAIIFKAERDNPNIKVVNTSQREMINNELKEKGALEALLEDEEGNITEGSRSNMFFVKGNKLYTAPSKKVLLGITRSKVMKICDDLGIEVVESDIKKSELCEVDGLFMSTTPLGVLPINSVGDIELNSENNEIIKKIVDGYEALTEEYIKNYK